MSDQNPVPPPTSSPVDSSAWHLQWWFIIVCFLVFWPVGMILLWVSPVPKKNAKIAVTAVMVLVPLLAGCGIVVALRAFSTISDRAVEQTAIEQPFEQITIDEAPLPEPEPEPEFDPSTAVRLAEGVTPEQHVRAHMQALVDGDYATAYALLPTDKQASYGDESAFAAQVAAYGVQSFTIDNVVQSDSTAEITATMVTPDISLSYLWTFVKDGDTWLLKSRTVPATGQ